MAKLVVISGNTFPETERRILEGAGFELRVVPGNLSADQITVELVGAWGYILGGSERMRASDWKSLLELRAVCFMGTGWKSFLELPEQSSNTHFTYTPYANAEAVAEFSLGLLIDSVRQISARAMSVRSGIWTEEPTPSLIGSRLGIIGMGHVGRSLAKMFAGSMQGQVVYWNRSERAENAKLPYERLDSIRAVCAASDNVAICLDYVAGVTDQLVDRDALTALGSEATLVNASRAELINPDLLRQVLLDNNVGRVAMDGYYIEPTPRPSEDPHLLLSLSPERLLVTPHCAYLGAHAVARMGAMARENLIAIAHDEEPPYPINR